MDLWFSEVHTPDVKLSLRTAKQLYAGKSEWQDIEEIDNLLNLIEQYQLKGVVAQVNSLKELKYIISNHIELSTREKMNIHYSLFLPRGGLSELYYMDANLERMMSVNNQLSYSIDTIEKFLMAD